jgi:DNA polymerase-1
MTELRNPDCEACALHKGRRTVCVPGDGDLDAEILLLGEAPGKQEDAGGLPFIGRSGELLRMSLEDYGIDKWYIRNTVNCWPPGNRTPTQQEMKACRPYLDATIAAMPNLRVIVCLGAPALKAIAKRGGIVKKCGKPFTKKVNDRAFIIMPCVHPAYVLRKESALDMFLGALRGVPGLLTGIERGFTRHLKGHLAVAEIKRRADVRKKTAFDFETTSLDPRRCSIRRIGFYSGTKGQKPVSCDVNTPAVLAAVREFCVGRTPKVVFNLGFEDQVSWLNLGVKLNNVVADVQLLSFRHNENIIPNLGSVAATWVPEVSGFKIDSELALREGETWGTINDAVLSDRNAVDCYATYKSDVKLERALGPEIMEYHRTWDLPIARFIGRMNQRGIALDRRLMLKRRDLCEAKMKKAARACKAAISRVLAGLGLERHLENVGSSEQVAREFVRMKYDTGKDAKTRLSTDEEAVKDLLAECPWTKPVIGPLLDYRKAQKELGTYVVQYGRFMRRVPWSEQVGLVRSSFWFPGTETWRLRSSRPNVQNMPRSAFRECVRSRYEKGYLVCVDFSQAELRILAALSRDRTMLRIYLEGLDIHSNTARRLFGKRFTKEDRYRAKRVNFGVIYGMSPRRLQLELRKDDIIISLAEAKAWIEGWLAEYPGAAAFMKNAQLDAKHYRLMAAPVAGLVRHIEASMGKRLDQVAREGANSPIQTSASFLTLMAGALTDQDLGEGESMIVNVVHDELVMDVPTRKEALRVAELAQGRMVETWQGQDWLDVPGQADPKIGKNWWTMKEVEI